MNFTRERSATSIGAWRLTAACLLPFAAMMASAATLVVNVIPTNQSAEATQNSEPSIAVQPVPALAGGKRALLISAFGSSDNPYFVSTNGGTIWTNFQSLVHGDTTVEWGNKPYLARLLGSDHSIEVHTSPSVPGTLFSLVPGSKYGAGSHPPYMPDQPWLKVANFGGADRLYLAFNDGTKFSKFSSRTASIHFSLDGGTTWNAPPGQASQPPFLIERLFPSTQDSAVRVAAAKDGRTVYAAFQRWGGSGPGEINIAGDIAVVRDDNQGLNQFGDLGDGSSVESGIVLPLSDNGGASLGSERLGSDCSIVVHPCDPKRVYVAFTEVLAAGNAFIPQVRVFQSADAGTNWTNVITIGTNSALPALAVAVAPGACGSQDPLAGSTLGLLYTAQVGPFLETHFLQAVAGDFSQTSDVILSRFPNNSPASAGDPYLGDYQDLEAVDGTFYGTFAASNDPDPAHFPSGVFYQRAVSNTVSHTIAQNFKLKQKGALVAGAAGTSVKPSIDPYFFQVTPFVEPRISIQECLCGPDFPDPEIRMRIEWLPDPPPGGWMGMIEATSSLTPTTTGTGGWAAVPNSTFQLVNGEATVTLGTSSGSPGSIASQRFFRVRLMRSATALYAISPAAGAHGTITPADPVLASGGQTQTFTATPDPNYQVDAWYLDGKLAQTGGSNFGLENILDDHALTVSFTPAYDLMLVMSILPSPVAVGSNVVCTLTVANTGINPASNVTVTDPLPIALAVRSIHARSATCTVRADHSLSCVIPSLARGESETIILELTPTQVGLMANTATISGASGELDLSNNTDSALVLVELPPQITTQPGPQSVPVGSSASFTVAADGTDPLSYQWLYNGNLLVGQTNSTLFLSSLTASQTGEYTVLIVNEVGKVLSAPVLLTVH